jgi:hypothetical protein
LQPDLRLYGWVQFFPALHSFAKLFEFYDQAIYSVGFILADIRSSISQQQRLLSYPAVFPNSPGDFLILVLVERFSLISLVGRKQPVVH